MKFKYNLCRTLFFVVIFLLMDFKYIGFNYGLTDFDTVTYRILSTSVGYNNSFLVIGLVVSALYIFGRVYTQTSVDAHLILRFGKTSFLNRLVLDTIIDSALIAFEFIGVMVFFCTLHFDFNLLKDIGLYTGCSLYFLSLFLYFLFVGILSLLVKITTNFKSVHLVYTTFAVFLLNGLTLIGISISPLYNSDFITDWFQKSIFNLGEYSLQSVKCFIAIAWIYVFARVIFVRKDFLENEKSID